MVDCRCRLAKRDQLGVGAWIAVDLPAIVSASDDRTVQDCNRAHWHVIMEQRKFGLGQRLTHPECVIAVRDRLDQTLLSALMHFAHSVLRTFRVPSRTWTV